MKIKMNNDRDWLTKMAENEDYGCVSVGGLYAQMLDEQQNIQPSENLHVLSRLVRLARCRKGMSLSELSEAANLDLEEVLKIEGGRELEPKPRVIFMLAKILGLPQKGLMELAGLMQLRNKSFSEAVVRFAAKSEPTAKLTHAEEEALQEFVKVLAEHSD